MNLGFGRLAVLLTDLLNNKLSDLGFRNRLRWRVLTS